MILQKSPWSILLCAWYKQSLQSLYCHKDLKADIWQVCDLNKDLMSHEEILSKNTVLQTISVEKQEESEKLKDFVFPNLKDKFAGG